MSQMIIHKSLHRPQQFMGVDRELCMGSILLSGIVGFGGFNIVSAACGAAFWVVSYIYLKKWAKSDPYLRDVYLRYFRQQSFYPAKSGLLVINKGTRWKK